MRLPLIAYSASHLIGPEAIYRALAQSYLTRATPVLPATGEPPCGR